MKDPLRAWIEDNGERKGFGGRGDIPDGLERAIGELRTSVIESDEANPREGYDSIRLDSLVFKFSLGIRIGEVVTTPLNCLDVEPVTQSPFLRVWTEKNQVPFARPIPHIWFQPVSEAITEITALTRDARARARQIEELGFQFVDRALSDYRNLHPLSKVEKSLIRALGYKEHEVAWPREIDDCLDEPAKSFERKQRNSPTTVKTPSVYVAAMVAWLDERFERWDWQDKRVAKYGKKRDHLSRWAVLTEVARDVGISMSEIKRNKKNKRLSKFIDRLDRFGLRPGMTPPQGAEGALLRSLLKRMWQKERAALMARSRWESYQTLVVVSRWKEVLEDKFRHSLRMHYKTEDVSCYIGPNAKAPRASLGPKSQLLSEHLFVVWENQFDLRTPRKGVLPVPMTHNHVYSYLCSNVKRATAFSRFGIKGPDSKPFSVAPHQIRHWLTTALMKSGPNEVMVDLWMGRTPGQSRIYDHRTARERAEAARSRYLIEEPPNDYLGRQVIRWRDAGLTRSKIAALIGVRLQILHFTPWGACARELSVMPCQKALACVRGYGSSRGCPHFVPNFADTEARLNLEKLLRDYQGLLISLEPRYDELKDRFRAELNTSEPLDQHLAFLHDMTAGIKTVLHEYKRHDEATVEKEAK